ncbi:sce7726 family protein [Alkalibacillus almallahensis]|uniref:sce7726 family protein n=1 Tax=Alkalibacillus almallahensis TaxID=1379154 RepID=UPI0014224E65|nr:sce7726 family protein [Alkalibacillus almallahensis]NIK11151.1 hypothetical protein [Alkalibacillus almallahensis]
MLLNEAEVRNLLLEDLNNELKEDEYTRIINELGIDYGASRVDVAVVNGIIHGYEIKSDLDTLDRLPNQISYYNRVFERMTIVSSRKYYEKVNELVPKWWGIKIISADGSRLICKRTGRRKNKNQDKSLLLKLLWKKDLENFVDIMGFDKKIKKLRKKQLLELFLQEAEIDLVRNYVYEVLKNREFWREES